MTDVSFAPLIDTVGKILVEVVIPAVVLSLGPRLAAMLRIKLNDQQWAIVNRTAEHWAKQLWAQAEPKIATAELSVGNPVIAVFAQKAINDIPDVVNKLGLNSGVAHQKMQEFILAHLGGLQAQAASVQGGQA